MNTHAKIASSSTCIVDVEAFGTLRTVTIGNTLWGTELLRQKNGAVPKG